MWIFKTTGTLKRPAAITMSIVVALISMFYYAGATVLAQQGLNDMVFTVGTTQTDAGGRPWAYLLWQGTKPELTSRKQFAIYAKSGDASSPALYTRKAIIFLQPDPLVIQTLLNRAVNLGESLPDLDDHINALFQKIIPTNTLSLAQKVSAVIQGASADPDHYNNLILLSRVHPGVSLCLGFAHAELIPPTGLMTYEVREYDKVKGQDIGVVGRVTVDPANPIVLPPPGPIAEFIDSSAKGDLNVKIRWATPPALRRLALLNYGFNVYRMTRAFAESNSYHVTPPTPAIIQNLTQTQPLFVRRLNRPPVLKSKDFDAVSVADFSTATGDPTTYFMMDDNGRYDSTNGVPFVDGDQYYYFVTARDVLGRDGLVSPGLLVKVCDRMPPLAPKGLRVINDYSFVGGVNKQVLKLIWNQNTNPPPGVTNPPPDITTAYYIYRWSSPSNMNALWQNPTNNLIKIIPHVNNQGTNNYVDDGAGSPNIATDASKTFWYSVRALDPGACGGNLSGNSAPAFGVLRDRVGPDAPSGHVFTQCAKPSVAFQGQGTLVRQLPDTNYYHIQLSCDATTPGIAWAEFYLFDPKANTLTYITRQHFLGGPHVQFDYLLPVSAVPQGQATIYCRVADVNGKLSNFATTTFDTPTPTTTRQLFFTGLEQVFTVDATSPQTGGRDCDRHISVVPGTLTVTCITGSLTISAKAQEWKVYRRVDNGELSLIEENFFSSTNVWKDCGMPVNSGSVCYYAQYFDEQGNASSFVLLACLTVQGTGELPIPVLSPIESTVGSTQLNPMMTLRWFCPPQPVERFQIGITVINPPGALIPPTVSSTLSSNLGSSNFVVMVNTDLHTNDFNLFTTPRVGPAFSPGPQYSVDVSIDSGQKYLVAIKAIGHDGTVGGPSNGEEFIWNPVTASGPQVPWPARGLPPNTNSPYSGPFTATYLTLPVYSGVGVEIGQIPGRSQSGTKQPYRFVGRFDPVSQLYSNTITGDPVFPVAMYRYQMPNINYPVSSGDVVQVSPLMEKIAYQDTVDANGSPITVIYDPFIAISSGVVGQGTVSKMYLEDTQPVISGARYRYALLRFDPLTKEVVEVIETNDVDIP